ncbi:MAG: hypothetical protein EPN89_08455 [Methylovulum sp.]|jgi:hypothetical protein|nr:MAG: hypothetical protein EPN89_08455 [Methylovulum sp.]
MLNFEDDAELMNGLPDLGLTKNLRIATRFIRGDISASISGLGFFEMGKTIPVKLMDISSKGVLISTNRKLRINKSLTLTLQFETGRTFIIKAAIVRRSASSHHQYGMKFERCHDELGDYLLESQSKLVFK